MKTSDRLLDMGFENITVVDISEEAIKKARKGFRDDSEKLSEKFEKIKCLTLDHITPSGSRQNFLFCSFRGFA